MSINVHYIWCYLKELINIYRHISILCYVKVRTKQNSTSKKRLKSAFRYESTVNHHTMYYVNN